MLKGTKSDLSNLEKFPVERFNQIAGINMWKGAKSDLSDLEKLPLERFNQIYLSICDLCHPKEASCQKIKINTEAFLRLTRPPPPSILTDRGTDRQKDDGQLGIRKAPLLFGWQSLKLFIIMQLFSCISTYSHVNKNLLLLKVLFLFILLRPGPLGMISISFSSSVWDLRRISTFDEFCSPPPSMFLCTLGRLTR